MAEIRVNDLTIPVPSLIQRIRTGIFTPDLLGDYSFPFTVRNTEQISLALGLPADPQSATDFSQPIPAGLYLRANRLYSGHLDVLEADQDDIKLVFVLSSGFFIQDNTSLSLQSCYDPEDTILLDPPYDEIGGYRIRCAHGDARLTVNGNVLLLEKDDYADQVEQLEAIADWLEGLGLGLIVTVLISDEGHSSASYIDYWDTGTVTTAEMVQMPNEGVNRSYIATPKTARRLLMGDYNTPDDANRIAFPMIYNPNLYEGANPIFDGIVNRYDDQGRLDTYNPSYYSFSDALQWQNTLIPFLYLTDVVKAIFAHLNIRVSGEFFDDPLIKKLLVYNNRPIDFLDVRQGAVSQRRTPGNVDAGDDNPEQTNLIYQNVFDFNIRLSRHVPDMPVLDFLKAIKNTFFLKYDFNLLQNAVEIRFVRSIIRSRESLDLTAKVEKLFLIRNGKESGLQFSYPSKDALLSRAQEPVPDPDHTVDTYTELSALDAEIDEFAYVRSLSATFRLEKEREDPATWQLYAFDVQDDPDRPESVDWPIGATPIADAYYEGWKLPSLEVTAYSPDANLFNTDTGIRLTVYYGQQADGQGRSYAFASANAYDATGSLDESQANLFVHSEDMKHYWTNLNNLIIRSKKYRTNVLLTESDRYTLNRTRIIRIANVLYLIDQIELLITDQERTLAKLDLYKLKT
ncbi:hypothetical protein [Cyclobacterium sp.]|uniref:hypothetical protein n=1 Tax=Cyclobacterium sp. TaxID=1966343 RepID=UPI00199411F2|nr:hypothetical protein [Cyclobacterium sp.]MBD3627583.1 hypothetical protein [Cyclobacterium sp.]